MKRNVSYWPMLGLAFCVMFRGGAASGDDPDPRVLLQGVASARSEIRSGELIVRAIYQSERVRTDRLLHVRFKDAKRNYVVLFRADPARSVYDGTDVMVYRHKSAIVTDPSNAGAHYLFDPRVLGLTTSLRPGVTIKNALRSEDAREVSLVGEEENDGVLTWHVKVVDGHDQQHHFWIEDAPLYRVHKYEYRYGDELLRTCVSHYGERPGMAALPESIEVRAYRGGELHYEREIEIVRAIINMPVEAKLFTMTGLLMAKGTPVSRENKRIGYWDGSNLVQSFVPRD
jgi:hypothetical protein